MEDPFRDAVVAGGSDTIDGQETDGAELGAGLGTDGTELDVGSGPRVGPLTDGEKNLKVL